jgi:molybdate transport system permease protein
MSLRVFTLPFLLIFAGLVAMVVLAIGLYSSPQALYRSLCSAEIRFALCLSFGASVMAVLLAMLVAVPAAYSLARYEFPAKGLVDTLIDLPIVLPPLVAGVGLLILLGPMLGNGLAKLGLRFVFTPLGVVMAEFFVATPFAIRSLRATFEGIDPRYEFVAQTLGLSQTEAFREVTLRMARGGLMASAVMSWSRAIGEFGATVMLAGATRFRTETLPAAVFLNMSAAEMDAALATAIIMVLFSTAALLIFKRMAKGRKET